jgi:hypothetical protein
MSRAILVPDQIQTSPERDKKSSILDGERDS